MRSTDVRGHSSLGLTGNLIPLATVLRGRHVLYAPTFYGSSVAIRLESYTALKIRQRDKITRLWEEIYARPYTNLDSHD